MNLDPNREEIVIPYSADNAITVHFKVIEQPVESAIESLQINSSKPIADLPKKPTYGIRTIDKHNVAVLLENTYEDGIGNVETIMKNKLCFEIAQKISEIVEERTARFLPLKGTI